MLKRELDCRRSLLGEVGPMTKFGFRRAAGGGASGGIGSSGLTGLITGSTSSVFIAGTDGFSGDELPFDEEG